MPFEIFAGPMVRRATTDKVCLWIATLGSPQVEGKLIDNGNPIGSGISKSISIRDKLYIHLIEIVPQDHQKFPTNRLIYYAIGTPSGTGFDYSDFDTAIIDDKFAYGNEDWETSEGRLKNTIPPKKPNLPSFYIQDENSKLIVVFGSCRKPHDDGADAFVKIDELLKSSYRDFSKRPTVLFLGGDQIYADDVEEKDVLPAVINLSKKLDIVEILPESTRPTVDIPDRTYTLNQMKFTTDEKKTHLLSLGEYIAMYGLVWNGKNWIGMRSTNVADFHQSLVAVRRVLANIPVYMIFDDHDVTDDWFITNKWKDEVLKTKNGSRVIANAMAAYFLFQGWGNDSEKFAFSTIKSIIENHVNIGSNKKDPSPFDKYFLERSMIWEFNAPTNPISYFLNTRTERDGWDFPPLLKSADSWNNLSIQVKNKNLPFLLVTPGPLVTFPGIDYAQEIAVKNNNQYKFDYESWFSNKYNYQLFFNYFQRQAISKVIILSGDVYYGFSAIFKLKNKEKYLGQPGGFELSCLQVTSSGLKNKADILPGFSLGITALVPYSGTLYFIFLSSNQYTIACDLQQAELRQLAAAASPILPAPIYAVSGGDFYRLRTFKDPISRSFYHKMDPPDYPPLVMELTIKSSSPKTADYLREHNFGLVKVQQNSVVYSFNNGPDYPYTFLP
ncbi:MAG: hypothetical protein WCL00_08705 [Bacteroidota bacterium]